MGQEDLSTFLGGPSRSLRFVLDNFRLSRCFDTARDLLGCWVGKGAVDNGLLHLMAVPLYGITLKCSKCGVVSSPDVSATATSNAISGFSEEDTEDRNSQIHSGGEVKVHQDGGIDVLPLLEATEAVLPVSHVLTPPGEFWWDSLEASLWSSCVVLPLLALTWMSAVLAITDRRSALFQILFAVFDSLEGFVIVMVHCILRREVQDAVKCRVVDRQEEANGDSGGSFQNGHAQLMTDFEKDVDMACRSGEHITVLNKDIGTCRTMTITGTLKRPSLQDEEKLKLNHPKGSSNFNSLPANVSKLHLQSSPHYLGALNLNDFNNHTLTLKKDKSQAPKSIYICDGDIFKKLDTELSRAQEQARDTSYVILPTNTSTLRPKPPPPAAATPAATPQGRHQIQYQH
ncbi:hypothetical protein Chor_002578 [Crotalus horridus]